MFEGFKMRSTLARWLISVLLVWPMSVLAEDSIDLVAAIDLTEEQSPQFDAAAAKTRGRLESIATDRLAMRQFIIEMDEPFKEILEPRQWGPYLRYKQALIAEAVR